MQRGVCFPCSSGRPLIENCHNQDRKSSPPLHLIYRYHALPISCEGSFVNVVDAIRSTPFSVLFSCLLVSPFRLHVLSSMRYVHIIAVICMQHRCPTLQMALAEINYFATLHLQHYYFLLTPLLPASYYLPFRHLPRRRPTS